MIYVYPNSKVEVYKKLWKFQARLVGTYTTLDEALKIIPDRKTKYVTQREDKNANSKNR